jgi:hypothetical protein
MEKIIGVIVIIAALVASVVLGLREEIFHDFKRRLLFVSITAAGCLLLLYFLVWLSKSLGLM